MQTLVAVYPTRAKAEQMKGKLTSSGIPADKIALSPDATTKPIEPKDRSSGFWEWLFGSDIPEDDRNLYSSTLRDGRTALSVCLADGTQRLAVESMLHEHGAIDLSPAASTAAPVKERIPVVKEELEVGKRQTEQRYHVRVYPVEHPVQETVNLRDERVVVERRPTSAYAPDGKDLAPREFDVVERHEKPVVAKKVRADEEVVVRKDVTDHQETVRDTVRETKVEVDKPKNERRRSA